MPQPLQIPVTTGHRVRAASGRPAGVLLAPVLVRQGARVRRETPVLPEAGGNRSGLEGPADGRPALRLLVLGESSAAGVGVAQQRDGLAGQLAVEIAARHGTPVIWQVVARTGATARAAARELVPAAHGPYDLVVVVLGVNDALRLRSRRPWRAHASGILDALAPQLAPGGQILLAGVPALGAFPALPQPLRTVLGWHARALDLELGAIAARRPGVLHAPAPGLSDELFAEDGFHPNGTAYARWAQQIADLVRPARVAPRGCAQAAGR